MELKKKAVTIGMIAILVCACVGGYLLGKQRQHTEDNEFFSQYINDACVCTTPLVNMGGYLSYDLRVELNTSTSSMLNLSWLG